MGAGIACFVIGGLCFVTAAALGVPGVWAVVLPMCLVSLANGSSLSLAVSGAIASGHSRSAMASGLVGFFQIGSAGGMALAISGSLGATLLALCWSVLALGLIAACAVALRTGNS